MLLHPEQTDTARKHIGIVTRVRGTSVPRLAPLGLELEIVSQCRSTERYERLLRTGRLGAEMNVAKSSKTVGLLAANLAEYGSLVRGRVQEDSTVGP
jgi:hypothetical protein